EEDPIDPEKPGEEDPEEPSTPDKPEKPEDPGTPGERPEIPGRPETPENSAQAEIEKNVAKKSTNPKTGIGSVATIFTSMGISIAGLMATTKKKKEDE
ncbi:LPXTG cell wall anchor domain-containing protein, partial [uncultured Anaerococcus sp.]|uniref:LPXTG cell wall anchor domain-containing protein n=1 Tax=uncultured Anaerococcus sp. TaxID=293428 RepID=UPI0026220E65